MKLRIEKAIYGGDGLARIPSDAGTSLAGKTVFVPVPRLPGELVEAAHRREQAQLRHRQNSMQFSSHLRSASHPVANMFPAAAAASTSMRTLPSSYR